MPLKLTMFLNTRNYLILQKNSTFFGYSYSNREGVSKVGDRSRGQPEGSLFNSYYTEV